MLTSLLLAAAGGPVDCPDGEQWDRETQQCVIVIEIPGDPEEPDPEPEPTTPPPKDDPDEPPVCMFQDVEIPCALPEHGYWVAGWNCYVRKMDPQPPKSDPVWEGNTHGTIFECTGVESEDNPDGVPNPSLRYPRWSAVAPPRADGADPAEAARRAVAEMTLKGITIGSTPPAESGRVGIIGFPTWLWAKDPAPNQIGPITKTVSAGGEQVTATAELDYIEWDMGNGDVVTCDGPGTPWDGKSVGQSPDCGYTYEEDGEYDLTATTYWTVTWEGMGQSGEIPMTTQNDGQLVMGEAQVLTQ